MKKTDQCVTGKKRYSSLNIAEDALIEAHTRFYFAAGSGPVAVYQCEDCGSYHFTSKGKMNERLEEQLKNGKIQRQKEANQWLDKFKNSR